MIKNYTNEQQKKLLEDVEDYRKRTADALQIMIGPLYLLHSELTSTERHLTRRQLASVLEAVDKYRRESADALNEMVGPLCLLQSMKIKRNH